jgi:ABC-type uncharacterized transport system ATPase subunit
LGGAAAIERNGKWRYRLERDAPIDRILAEARSHGEVTRFSFEPPSLTDLFREAVRQ